LFSAFSFGKIIKTVLPGSLLFATLVLVVEAIWRLVENESPLAILAKNELIAPFSGVAIIFSLILGFLLNTFVWITLNKQFRAASDAELKDTIFYRIRNKLSSDLWDNVVSYLDNNDASFGQNERNSTRVSLEYYYLPYLSLENLNYLWESYFSWYEFLLNTACAFAVLAASGIFFFGVLWIVVWDLEWGLLILVGVLMAVTAVFIYMGLRRAALRNLVNYEKNLMFLLMGSFSARSKT
jgi:hypothetical protein